MRTLGILAHIDAGKTTLSERMLWLSGSILHYGEVEEGLATLDFLPEEQERGITIQTGIERVEWKGKIVQLLDTPGHIDFGPEVTGVLSALDGAVLVVSGVRHLQTQTLSAWHRLREKEVPTIVFINRLDLPGSDLDETVIRLEDELGIPPILLSWPLQRDGKLEGVIDILNRVAVWSDPEDPEQFSTAPIEPKWKNLADRLYEEVLSVAAEEDEELFELHLEGKSVDLGRLIAALSKRVEKGGVLPTYCGSAKKCVGVRQLLNGIVWLVPENRTVKQDVALRVIRVRWTPGIGRWYLAQSMRPLKESDFSAKFFALHAGQMEPVESVELGEVFGVAQETMVWRPGDLVSATGRSISQEEKIWGEPLLSLMLEATDLEEHERLGDALQEMSAADPTLRAVLSQEGGWVISGLGEVHLDVAVERLRRDFRVRFNVGDPKIQKRERWVAIQRNLELESRDGECNLKVRLSLLPFEASSPHLVIEEKKVESGLPREVLEAAVEEFVQKGVTGNGPIVHLRIVVHEARWEGDFQPELFKKLLLDLFRLKPNTASVRIEEPNVTIEVWTPSQHHGAVLTDLLARGAKITLQDSDGYHWRIEARLPLKSIIGYTVSLRSITRGTASFAPISEEWDLS